MPYEVKTGHERTFEVNNLGLTDDFIVEHGRNKPPLERVGDGQCPQVETTVLYCPSSVRRNKMAPCTVNIHRKSFFTLLV